MKNSKIKNLRKIAQKHIDEFQSSHQNNRSFNDPRGTMSDVGTTCSLLRKEIRGGYICKNYFPKSIRGDDFDNLVAKLETIMKKIRTCAKAQKELYEISKGE